MFIAIALVDNFVWEKVDSFGPKQIGLSPIRFMCHRDGRTLTQTVDQICSAWPLHCSVEARDCLKEEFPLTYIRMHFADFWCAEPDSLICRHLGQAVDVEASDAELVGEYRFRCCWRNRCSF